MTHTKGDRELIARDTHLERDTPSSLVNGLLQNNESRGRGGDI